MISKLYDLLGQSVTRCPDRLCVSHGPNGRTYAELDDEVRRLAGVLMDAGVAPGDRVALHLDKSIDEVVAILAISTAGGVFVNINPLLKGRQVRHILEDSGARILMTSYPRLKTLGEALTEVPELRTIIASGTQVPLRGPSLQSFDLIDRSAATAARTRATPVRRIDRDLAAIIYTSGSTGLPKGVVLSHRNLIAGAESVSTYVRNTSDDRILSVLPFSFDAGLNQLTTVLLVGASLVLKTYLSPGDTLRTLEIERITGLAGIPTLWSQLLQADWTDRTFPDLRYITNTGGRFAEEQVREYRQRLPHTDIYLMYGLTEAFRSTYLEPDQVDDRPTSIGKAIPNAEILVVDDHGRPCGPNEVGELVHRGVHVAQGYWNDPRLTEERFRRHPLQPPELPVHERVVYSGDLVRTDDDGYLYFIGRKDHMIKTAGFRVSPTEVEEYFYNTGLVQDVVAYGVADPEAGERIKVVLSIREGVAITGAELLATVSRQMPAFMVPKDVDVRESLPKNSSGKIDRPLVCSGAA